MSKFHGIFHTATRPAKPPESDVAAWAKIVGLSSTVTETGDKRKALAETFTEFAYGRRRHRHPCA